MATLAKAASAAELLDGIKVIDVDTHLSEPHDLWTSRAPAKLKNLVPRVVTIEGRRTWIIGEDTLLSGLGATPVSVIHKDGSKSRSLDWFDFEIEQVHPGAYALQERLKVMDEMGIHAQILFPNVLGFGGQNGWNAPENLRIAAIQIYNDAVAEYQSNSNNRIFPMALLPWWDVREAVKEAERAKAMGLRGVIINSDPQVQGLPDLAERHWDPMWEAFQSFELPVNFHIGASESTFAWFGSSPWPSGSAPVRFCIGSSLLFFSNAQIMANIIMSGILDRWPKLKFISVESGVNWVPGLLETLEYQIAENADTLKYDLSPREYFERNMFATFWYEKRNIAASIRQAGVDNVMFETDFPHPTCLYPDPLEQAAPALAQLTVDERRKVMSTNAATLFNIPI